MTAPQTIYITQLGAIVGRKLRLGEIKPGKDGKPTIKLTRTYVPLGDGIDVSDAVPVAAGYVCVSVTAEAAKRLNWPHPGNLPKRGPAEVARIQKTMRGENYGDEERKQACRTLISSDGFSDAEREEARFILARIEALGGR